MHPELPPDTMKIHQVHGPIHSESCAQTLFLAPPALRRILSVVEPNTGLQYVDEDRIAEAISRSLTDVLVAKYTRKFQDDPLPFTETRIEWLHGIAPKFHDWTLIGTRNAIRLLLSGNGILTGTSGFKQLDVHNFSGLHVLRSTVNGDTADVFIGGLPQLNPFDLTEIRVRMVRIPNSRQWRIEEIPDATPIFAKYFDAPTPSVQP
jgi:hypothetical protein